MRIFFPTAPALVLFAVLVGVDAQGGKNATQTLPKPEVSVTTYGNPQYTVQA